MASICRWFLRVFVAIYLIALALMMVGTFGLFGQEEDPLAGIFLLPLGVPWILVLEEFPDSAGPWLACLAPVLNLILLAGLCRAFSRPARPG